VDDDLGVLGQLGRVHLHLQQLRRATDAAQRVLDLVGQVADQLLVGLRLVDQALLAVLARLRLQRQQLDDDFAGRSVWATITCTGRGRGCWRLSIAS
jgi:hypothetical protein